MPTFNRIFHTLIIRLGWDSLQRLQCLQQLTLNDFYELMARFPRCIFQFRKQANVIGSQIWWILWLTLVSCLAKKSIPIKVEWDGALPWRKIHKFSNHKTRRLWRIALRKRLKTATNIRCKKRWALPWYSTDHVVVVSVESYFWSAFC